METVVKFSILGIVLVMLALLLKKSNAEYALLLVWSGTILAGAVTIKYIVGISDEITALLAGLPDSETYLRILFRIVAMSYLCEMTAQISREAGYASLGSQIEMAGKMAIIMIGFPIITTLFDLLKGMV